MSNFWTREGEKNKEDGTGLARAGEEGKKHSKLEARNKAVEIITHILVVSENVNGASTLGDWAARGGPMWDQAPVRLLVGVQVLHSAP